MADITTDVLIIGTGPAGGVTAALLASYGIKNMVINRYGWLAQTPRAHITNQRTMEVLRDLGKDVEDEAYMHATGQDLMGENVFCKSLAGEELGRMKSWGTHPLSAAEHALSSPSLMNDLPQTFMEPLLFKTACSRGTNARMNTEYLSHEEDQDGVTTLCLDKLTGENFTIRSQYLVGADGGNSLVAEQLGLPFEGEMGVGGSMNIHFKADLSKYVAHRPSVLYWVMQPGADIGGIGMGLVRMVRPWNEWLIVWGYDVNQPAPNVDEKMATQVARQLVGDPELEIELLSANTWTVNNMYASHMQSDRVFIMGDAAHRHPPSNGLGSNTSMQDGFNLAWKLAMVVNGQAGVGLLKTYSQERVPVAKQIVSRANQSIGETGKIFDALGLTGESDPTKMQANMDARTENSRTAEKQRNALREAIAFKKYEFDAHGVEMNQRYHSAAVQTDGQRQPLFKLDEEMHYQPTTWPGARLPHVWVYDDKGQKHSTLDLCGHGKFTGFTGIGGEPWVAAAKKLAAQMNIDLTIHIIGPQQPYADYTGDWARAKEIGDSGLVLVRPDHHIAWRKDQLASNPLEELTRVFANILDRQGKK